MASHDRSYSEAGVPAAGQHEGSDMSRRGMLRKAVGLSAVGIASGLALTSFAGAAQAAPAESEPLNTARENLPQHPGPVVAHLSDARTGAVDLFVGEQHLKLHDPALAAALARAAAAAEG